MELGEACSRLRKTKTAMITAVDATTHAVIRSYPRSGPSVSAALAKSVVTTTAAKSKVDACPLAARPSENLEEADSPRLLSMSTVDLTQKSSSNPGGYTDVGESLDRSPGNSIEEF